MGIWSSTLFGSGGAIQWMRWQGTLEIAIAAPVRFLWVLLPLTLSTATIGLYSIAATLFWGRIFFGVPLEFEHPLCSRSRCPSRSSASACSGSCWPRPSSSTANASAFSNLLEYPVWLVTGLLVPLSLLPGWVEPLSWVLAPTWGMRGGAERGARRRGLAAESAMCVLLGGVYLVLGVVLHAELRAARPPAARPSR